MRASATTGRIFMGAKDGCLYEFFYQEANKKKKKKLNPSYSISFDNRHLLTVKLGNFSLKESDKLVRLADQESQPVAQQVLLPGAVVLQFQRGGLDRASRAGRDTQRAVHPLGEQRHPGVLLGRPGPGDLQAQLPHLSLHSLQGRQSHQVTSSSSSSSSFF
jgi:hypothetical protein